jgi:chaperonin cofactor prefoldin
MLKLYEITGEYLTLCQMAEDTDVDATVFVDTIASIKGELEVKADSYAMIITNLNGDIEKIDKEIERLTHMKKVLKNRTNHLKNNLENAMKMMDVRKLKTDFRSYSIQKNPQSLNIIDESKIPAEYLISQDPKLDRTRLLADVKANPKKFAGIAETKQTESLRIR